MTKSELIDELDKQLAEAEVLLARHRIEGFIQVETSPDTSRIPLGLKRLGRRYRLVWHWGLEDGETGSPYGTVVSGDWSLKVIAANHVQQLDETLAASEDADCLSLRGALDTIHAWRKKINA